MPRPRRGSAALCPASAGTRTSGAPAAPGVRPTHLYSPAVPSAAIVTIGNELVSGDVANTNGSWLAARLERIGVDVGLVAAIPDVVDSIALFVREQAAGFSIVLVTGGLGGTPDDVTREGVAAAFGVGQAEDPAQAERILKRFAGRNTEYALRWAQLPI